MTCCGGDIVAERVAGTSQEMVRLARADDLARQGVEQPDGSVHFTLSVPAIHCGNCLTTIERALKPLEGVIDVRVNLTLKRVSLKLAKDAPVLDILDALEALGYPAFALDHESAQINDGAGSEMLKALAVAGFAAMNVMLLSVSTWSGADGATRDLFHLISALIAIPAVAYSGRIFFRSAWGALKRGRLNMDVPISLAILLATAMSLYETLNHGQEAYFDAAVSLLFFLLIGRYLDQRMRERARNAVIGLSKLSVKGANIILPDGGREFHVIDEIEPGMVVAVLPGERIPVDGVIRAGTSDLDLSLVTGENVPETLGVGAQVQAGTYNLTGALEVTVTKPASKSFLAEVSEMLGAAEQGRGDYVRLADRMAQIYAPAVHLLAAAAFVFWMLSGAGWHTSLYVSIALLIITCPCALGLAVPVVHVVAATRLFEEGILLRDGSGLERIADVDHAVFDKTGTLTQPELAVVEAPFGSVFEEQLAHALANHSSHPASRAIARHLSGHAALPIESVTEKGGCGIEAVYAGKRVRLGKTEWVEEIASTSKAGQKAATKTAVENRTQLSFAIEGKAMIDCALAETLRPQATSTVAALRARGIDSEILSGDRDGAVARIAQLAGIDRFAARQTPEDKINRIEALKAEGRKPLMVGDGLNDAPCLAAGYASMAPASASDIGRAAADFVFTRDGLEAVPFAISVAKKAKSLVLQNFGIAIAYNCIAVPLAFAGYVTPLFAAIAMSASSIVVIANSLRLTRHEKRRKVRPVTNEASKAPSIEGQPA